MTVNNKGVVRGYYLHHKTSAIKYFALKCIVNNLIDAQGKRSLHTLDDNEKVASENHCMVRFPPNMGYFIHLTYKNTGQVCYNVGHGSKRRNARNLSEISDTNIRRKQGESTRGL